MKKLRRTNVLLALLIAASFILTSCSTDDDITPQNPEGEDGAITLYTVNGASITKKTDFLVTGSDLEDQLSTEKHDEIWELTKRVITPEYLAEIKEFVLYNGVSQESDAFVAKITDDLTEWKIGVAINYAYEDGYNHNGSLQKSLTHEFGHFLSLNDSQLDGLTPEASCSNYYPEDGCAKTDAYINIFYNTFWTSDLVEEFDNNANNTQFYNDNKDKFVSEYAASSPIEDFAEVFAQYVIDDLPAANSTAIKDLKVLSFNNHPELVALRATIRTNLGL